MFTQKTCGQSQAAAPKAGMKTWIRRSAAIVSATLVGTTALAGSGLTAAPAQAIDPQSYVPELVTRIDFEGAGTNEANDIWGVDGWWRNGNAELNIVSDPDDYDNRVLQVGRQGNAFDGISSNTGLFQPGYTYTFGMNARLVGVPTIPEGPETIIPRDQTRIEFVNPGWDQARIWAWHQGGGNLFENWNTAPQMYLDGDVWTFDLPEGVELPINVIFHNGAGTQMPAGLGYGANHYVVETSSLIDGATVTPLPELTEPGTPAIPGIYGPADVRFELTNDSSWEWVGNTTVTADEWTPVFGQFTFGDNAPDFRAYLASSPIGDLGEFDFLVDDITIFRMVPVGEENGSGDHDDQGDGQGDDQVTEPGQPTDKPAINIAGEKIAHLTFANGNLTDQLGNQWTEAGVAGIEFITEANNTVAVKPITADWQGLQTPAGLITNGGEYNVAARVRRAAGSGDVRFVSSDNGSAGWSWIGNTNVGTDWTIIQGTVAVNGFDNPIVRINADNGTVMVDEVIVTRVGTTETPAPAPERVLINRWDFATLADLGDFEPSGPATLTRIPNPHGEGYVMAVTRADDWHGPRLISGILTPGAEYQLEITARTADGVGVSQIQPRGLSGGEGWAYMGNININDTEWTQGVSGTWQAGAAPQINIGSQNVGSGAFTLYIDEIALYQTAPAPEWDDNWVFEPRHFNFEDGLDGWFVRNASGTTPVLTHVEGAGAANSTGFASVTNRGNQGDGPMLDVREMLAPMQRFQISGYARFIDRDGTGALTLSSQTGPSTFTNLLQGIQVGNEWTHFSGEFMMPAFSDMANLYFETPWQSGAIGDITGFEIDEISITLPDPLEWEQDLIPLWSTLPGIHTGVAVDSRELSNEHADVVAHHFTHLVGENHMKPEAWFDGARNFRMHPEARQMMDFAVENDMTVFGHVLVWHSQTPSWLFAQDQNDPNSPELTNSPEHQEIMLDRMRQHIRDVAEEIVRHYGPFGSPTNPINSYEVANEVVAASAAQGLIAGGMRPNSPWTRIFYVPGVENSAYRFVREAFVYADQIFNGEFHVNGTVENPAQGEDRITLWINDYNTERGTGRPDNPTAKRTQLLNLVNYLIETGSPIDGVGHQFHAGLEWDVRGLYYALELFAEANEWLASFPGGERGILQAITEIDVTIPGIGPDGVTEAQLIAQGHYYRQAFDIIRNHQVRHGDIDTVTIWGLTDGRSWRAAQLPLLFNDDLTAKHAFHGAVQNHHILTDGTELPQRPGGGNWNAPSLPTVVMSANVFGGSVELTEASFDAPVWRQLPAHTLAEGAGSFHVRHSDGYLTVLANINGLESDRSVQWGGALQPYYIQLNLDGRPLTISQDGTVRAGDWDADVVTDVTAITRLGATGWQAIIRIPHQANYGSTSAFNIVRRDRSRAELGAWSEIGAGVLTFVDDLAFVQIPQAPARPVVGADFDRSLWADAAVISTDRVLSGGSDTATADVRAMWFNGSSAHHVTNNPYATLYLLVDVADNTPDVTSGNFHEQDSVEVFLGLVDGGNRGGLTALYDAQFRVSRAGVHSFGQGDNAIQAQRIRSFVVDNGVDGYTAVIAIAMRTDTGHLQGQWNYSLAGLNTMHNFDVQVNDGFAGSRAGHAIWGDSTGGGFNSTARLGVAELVYALVTAPDAPGTDRVFYDVEADNHFANYIHWLNANGLAAGWAAGPGQTLELPTFRPSNQMTREAMAAFLYRAAGSPEFALPDTPSFNDIADTTFELEIEWMYANGIAAGWADGSFRPGTAVTRGAMAAFLFRFHNSPEVVLDGASFVDVPADSAQAGYIAWLAEFEIAQGWADGTFRPLAPITREAMAAFMHRAHTAASNGHFDLGNWNLAN